MNIQSANLGFPRIGARRELKKAVEGYWNKALDVQQLRQVGADLRKRHWQMQADAGIDVIPSNDFSFYDQVLDMVATVGAVPERFGHSGDEVSLDTYFMMARGSDDAPAMEMTKWFDTNYHYIVPEFTRDQTFSLGSTKPVDEFVEAREKGFHTRPVLIGPVTLLLLGKSREPGFEPIELLDNLLPVYRELLDRLGAAGADWVQVDEPALGTDLEPGTRTALEKAYAALSGCVPGIMLATYFEGPRDNLPLVAALPVDGVHLDLARAPETLERLVQTGFKQRVLSLGVIDGRHIWRADLDRCLEWIERAAAHHTGAALQIAPSCSLLHVPVDVEDETRLDPELKSWLAFARQKLDELRALARAASEGAGACPGAFDASRAARASRCASGRIRDDAVRDRMAAITESDYRRGHVYPERSQRQHEHLELPTFPATTIGSFPQTREVRRARAAFRRGDLDAGDYDDFVAGRIRESVRWQEQIGLDVLVHGEYERNDMVEYFGEQLDGFAFTQYGWVQSYGSRCVKPPVIFGDVSRPGPMTVDWLEYAQSLTARPVKAMLTGPVTILQWSFVRDDQPREDTCRQIALAIRDEVADLERAGLGVIQIDEPALREGLPLRQADRDGYLDWASRCFRLASSVVADRTQIHTHMCYSEFNDIMPAIAALDADVISIEASRSGMELLDSFVDFEYPNEIGPGVWDIHSPRVPSADEMHELLRRAAEVIDPGKLWVNPDCGLKTRGWPEVEAALKNMVTAARAMRDSREVRASA